MKKILFILVHSCLVFDLCAQSMQPSSSPGQGVSPSTIYRPPLSKPPEKIGPKPAGQTTTTPVQAAPAAKPKLSYRPLFTQPGILSLSSGGFIGMDHLYNVSDNIPVIVEIAKPDNMNLQISREKIQAIVEKAFESEGIVPMVKPSTGPALPYFQLLVMVIPAGEGVSAFSSGRLFEKVELERVALPPNVYFQAITWEYQNLIFSSKEDSEKELDAAIAEIVDRFLSRYKYYKNIKAQ